MRLAVTTMGVSVGDPVDTAGAGRVAGCVVAGWALVDAPPNLMNARVERVSAGAQGRTSAHGVKPSRDQVAWSQRVLALGMGGGREALCEAGGAGPNRGGWGGRAFAKTLSRPSRSRGRNRVAKRTSRFAQCHKQVFWLRTLVELLAPCEWPSRRSCDSGIRPATSFTAARPRRIFTAFPSLWHLRPKRALQPLVGGGNVQRLETRDKAWGGLGGSRFRDSRFHDTETRRHGGERSFSAQGWRGLGETRLYCICSRTKDDTGGTPVLRFGGAEGGGCACVFAGVACRLVELGRRDLGVFSALRGVRVLRDSAALRRGL